MQLLEFIRQLENKNLLKFDILGGSDESFNNRFRIQKLVFIAKYFGLVSEYNYRIYLHGPYSSQLADDYFNLAKHINSNNMNKEINDNRFDKEDFFDFVQNRDDEWLEACSTMLSLADVYSTKEVLLSKVCEIKAHIHEDKINQVFSELNSKGIIKFGKKDKVTDLTLMDELQNSSSEFKDIYEKLGKEVYGYNFSM
jgi:uncharacterized protein YwgA